ncbi:MAG TPA: hypothetical protein VF857_06660 [Spirochaetota bacterium]
MRQIIVTIFLVMSSPLLSQTAGVSTEYRHDALDTEDLERNFVRCKGFVMSTKNTGAYAAAAWVPSEKRKSYSFAWMTSETFLPFSMIGGDYNVRFGSGLLVGKGHPYNPDPFSKDSADDEMETGVRPNVNGSQTSSFRGIALSRNLMEKNLGVTLFASRALRYYSGDNSSSSIGTLLTRSEREDRYREPVYLRSAGMMLQSQNTYFVTQLSSYYADLLTPSGKRILWASARDGEGYRSSSGGSLYCGYNDGVIRSYGEFAVSSAVYRKNETDSRSWGRSFQSETVVKNESFVGRIAFKNVAADYYSPFNSPMGSLTPSKAIFMDAAISPEKSVKVSADASFERKNAITNFDPELTSPCKEGFLITVMPDRWISFSAGHRLVGYALQTFPDRQQFRGKAEVKSKADDHLGIEYIEQRGAGALSRVIECEGGFKVFKMLSVDAQYSEIRTQKDSDVYMSPLPLDGVMVPWIAVSGRAHLASMKLSVSWKGVVLRARSLFLWSGQEILRRRIECAAEGTW